MNRKLSKLIAISMLMVGNTALLVNTIRYSNNNLSQHSAWIPAKRLLSASIMGAHETVFHRNPLHGNRLNLDAWYGYQKLYHGQPLNLGELDFDFMIGLNGYLVVEYARTKNEIWGMRFSRHTQFPSLHYRATVNGSFLEKQPLTLTLGDDRSRHARLQIQDGKASVLVEDMPVHQTQVPPEAIHTIAFRSGRNRAIVDNVEAISTSGETLIVEDFSGPLSAAVLFWSFLLVLLLTTLPFAWRHVRYTSFNDTLLRTMALQMSLTIVVATYHAGDYFVWSPTYFAKGVTPSGQQVGGIAVTIEAWRSALFEWLASPLSRPYPPDYRLPAKALGYDDSYAPFCQSREAKIQIQRVPGESDLVPLEAFEAYLVDRPFSNDVLKIIMLGGSQAWGAGAAFTSDRLAFQIHEALQLKLKRPVVVVNGARSGAVVNGLRRRYEILSSIEPDVVLIQVGTNDSVDDFDTDLRALLRDVQRSARQAILILEPNSIDTSDPPDNGGLVQLSKKHDIMRALGQEFNVPVHDLHGVMAGSSILDSGFLWWDFVHLTSLGQELAARSIAKSLMRSLLEIESDPHASRSARATQWFRASPKRASPGRSTYATKS